MTDEKLVLTTFSTSWKEYQDHVREALAPLTTEQLGLRGAPGLRSVGEIALHLVGCRMFWFTQVLGEDGSEELRAYARWNDVALGAPYASRDELARALEAPAPTAAELVQALDRTWQLMADYLARSSPADLRRTFPVEDNGQPIELSPAWVVWHVLEHDLHHGGELSLTLGMHGIPAEFAL